MPNKTVIKDINEPFYGLMKIPGINLEFVEFSDGVAVKHSLNGKVYCPPEFYLKASLSSLEEGEKECLRELESIIRCAIKGVEDKSTIRVIVSYRHGFLRNEVYVDEKDDNTKKYHVGGNFSIFIYETLTTHNAYAVGAPYSVSVIKGNYINTNNHGDIR